MGSPAQPPGGNMKITAIETLRADAGWRMFSFLKVTTDSGIVGWSEYNESFGSPGLSGVIEKLVPLLIGQDPRPVERVISMLHVNTRQSQGGADPAGDRGDRERAARRQGEGSRRSRLRAVPRPGARSHSGLLVAYGHVSRAQRRDDGRAAAAHIRRCRAARRGDPQARVPRDEDEHDADGRRQARALQRRFRAQPRDGRS